MLCPTKCCDNLLRAADTTNSWKDMRADIVMFFFRERVHRIFGEHLVVAMLVGLAGRGINAKAGGNATQDNGCRPSSGASSAQSLGRSVGRGNPASLIDCNMSLPSTELTLTRTTTLPA